MKLSSQTTSKLSKKGTKKGKFNLINQKKTTNHKSLILNPWKSNIVKFVQNMTKISKI